jgi:hypothetical protein
MATFLNKYFVDVNYFYYFSIMKYELNSKVFVKDTTIEKKIVDAENIFNTWIYYMLDKTSYSESQIQSESDFQYDYIISKIKDPLVFSRIFDTKKTAKAMSEWYNKNVQ